MRRCLLAFTLLGKTSGLVVWFAGGSPGLALALFFVPGFVLLYHLFAPSAQGLVRVATHFETSRREVWLTIDDGPNETDTPRALALLARHRAKATFFLIGERAARLPHLVRAIREAGHEIGHHTQTHPAGSFWCASPARLSRELDGFIALLAAEGAPPRRFRPPVGIKHVLLAPALQARGLTCIGWSVRSWDSVRRDPVALVDHVMRRVRPGSIVLVHEGPRLHPKVRTGGLASLLIALDASGYACVVPEASQLR